MLIRAIIGLLMLSVVSAAEPVVSVAAPDLAVRVGRLLADDYYDRNRIRPRLMIERGLRALEGAEIGLDTTWADGTLTLRISDRSLEIPAAEPRTLTEAMALLDAIRAVLAGDAAGLEAKRSRDLGYALINGALSSLDPHTVLMPPEPAEEFDQDIRGEFGGIGAYLQQEAASGEVLIERVMPERPAEKAGVQDGDVIVAVNGESTAGLSLDQCVRRIKGPKGSTVTLTLRRKAQMLDIAVVRDMVLVPTMASYKDRGVGYLRMDEFNARTLKMLRDELITLQAAGDLQAMVLDLRYNGGGLLDQAYFISDLFLEKDKEVVQTIVLGGDPQKRFSSPRKFVDVPVIVMVGPGSASAAEILSGALQRNDRAVVAGATTYGKGSVQSIRPLNDGSRLKLTIQEYRLAGGVSIQDVGVMPDLRLNRRMLRDDGGVDLVPYSSAREHDEEFALVVADTYQHAATYELGWMAEALSRDELRKSNISSREFVPDQEARLVLDLLIAALATEGAAERLRRGAEDQAERQALLEVLRAPVAERAQREAAALADALAKSDPPVVWGEANAVPAKALKAEYRGPKQVAAGETVDLTFAVHNGGDSDIGRLYAVLEGDRSSPLYEEEVIFGTVAAGQEGLGHLRFAMPPRLHPGVERFTFALYQDGQREALTRMPVDVTVTEAPRPHLSLKYAVDDAVTAITPGSTVQVKLTVVNDGEGATAPLNMSVFKDNDADIELKDGVFRLDALEPGGSTEVLVPLTLKVGTEARIGSKAVVLVHVEERFDDDVDARYRASLFHKISLPIGADIIAGQVVQPRLSVAEITVVGNQAEFAIKVEGKDLRFVGAFHDRDKIDYRQAHALTDGIYRFNLELKPGLNPVRILASGVDDITDVLPLRLWGPAEAVAEATAEVKKPLPVEQPPEPVLIP